MWRVEFPLTLTPSLGTVPRLSINLIPTADDNPPSLSLNSFKKLPLLLENTGDATGGTSHSAAAAAAAAITIGHPIRYFPPPQSPIHLDLHTPAYNMVSRAQQHMHISRNQCCIPLMTSPGTSHAL